VSLLLLLLLLLLLRCCLLKPSDTPSRAGGHTRVSPEGCSPEREHTK
jgi:hypothetical protein